MIYNLEIEGVLIELIATNHWETEGSIPCLFIVTTSIGCLEYFHKSPSVNAWYLARL